ncbi:hypothetical protein BRADI_4g35202v3 [Brachypodium distachyon]|uniref:Retrovirus-related Pol polyprotein from transposon TNT 1-94-like beta-barrel domain-containing protein n=2 Tax=Brachypodium distachyon TaxID=15368 RepID=A0A2K2CSD1_BRADI|nr:hypothetical protein BRADI_4g35202v3 [Brachypodium distachyon]
MNPSKIKKGSANSKHIVLTLKINSQLDPYNTEDDNISLENDIEVNLVKSFGHLCCISRRPPVFYLDSGAGTHICNNKAYMKDLKPIEENNRVTLHSADGGKFTAEEMGLIAFENINLSQVSYIPYLPFNLISVGQLDEDDLLISIVDGQFQIIDLQNCRVVGEGYRDSENKDYVVRSISWVHPDREIQSEQFEADEEDDVAATDPEKDGDYEKWIIDSMCAAHLTGRKDVLKKIKRCEQVFTSPKDRIMTTHSGVLRIKNLKLPKVLYSPDIKQNLISVGSLDGEGYRFAFHHGKCGIVCEGTLKHCGSGTRNKKKNMYYLDEFIPEKTLNTNRKRKKRR